MMRGPMATLLLIDDEPAIRHAFQRAFKPPAFELSTASTAAEGLAAADRLDADVIILDIRLPDATGLATFERLHARHPHAPIILITGQGTTELAIEAIKLGAYEYLLKPL